MTLPHNDERDISWFFGQYAFHRSTFGAMCERAQIMAYGSDGKRIPVRQDGEMKIKHVTSEPSYEPDDQELQTYARVSRRLVALSRGGDVHVEVLGSYYGNDGARWATQAVGRIWSLMPLTRAGAELLRSVAARAVLKKHSLLDLQPAERLANEREANRLHPIDARASALRRMADQADQLLRGAQSAWKSTAPGFTLEQPDRESRRALLLPPPKAPGAEQR